MNFEEYQRIKAINATSIKAGALSMLHMHAIMEGESKEQTPAMRWGSLVHKAILERGEFAGLVSVYPGAVKRGKEWEAFKAENDPDYIVTESEKDALERIRDNVHDNKAAHELIESAIKEVTIQWVGEYGDAKARLDGFSEVSGIVELKTSKVIAPIPFGNTCVKSGYDLQVGFYVEGAMLTGMIKENPKVTIIAVESVPPYDVAVYTVPRMMIEVGRSRARKIALEYRRFEELGEYPGVSEGVQELTIPAWYGEDELMKSFFDCANEQLGMGEEQ